MIEFGDLRAKLGEDAYAELLTLHSQLNRHRPGNRDRARYYDMHNGLKDLGLAIPPRFRSIEVVSGWGSKAVDHLARRIRMESFTLPGADDPFGVTELWEDNSMEVDLPQAVTSALIHSPGFLLTLPGDTSLNEMDAVISGHDALHATGRWNWSRRGLDSALILLDNEAPSFGSVEDALGCVRFLLFHDGVMYDCRRVRTDANLGYLASWDVFEEHNASVEGRIPVEPLLYHPRTSRPFGGSRITPAVQYIIDAAMRGMIRTELHAEFFAAPQRYALNVDEKDLYSDGKTQWDIMMGKMLTLGASENPEDPDAVLGQFPQSSMQPHVDLLRMWATILAGETSIPVGSLGVVQDNPSSADAIHAAKEDLVLEAEECARTFAPAIRRTAINAVMLREGLTEVPDELKRLNVRWIDPSTPSRAQATDAVVKQVSAGILPAESDVTLELLGFSSDVIERITEDRRREAARQTVRDALAINVNQAPVPPPQDQPVEDFRAANPQLPDDGA